MTSSPGTPQTNSLRFPDLGAVRVHPDPAALPRLRHEGPGRNRFDDPQGAFVVRYAAYTLHRCLVETLSRFPPLGTIEDLTAKRPDFTIGAITIRDSGQDVEVLRVRALTSPNLQYLGATSSAWSPPQKAAVTSTFHVYSRKARA